MRRRKLTMKKRIIAILMAVILLPVFSVGCGTEDVTMNTEESLMTRAQWIIGLGTAFGMNEYSTETPFYEDVDSSQEIYPFVQSCAEWEIFAKTGGNFNPEENVTREFAVQTTVMAAEVLNHITDDSVYEECISYAIENGIMESDKEAYLEENLTYAEGQEILEWAVSQYQNREFVEYADVEMNEEVLDMSDSEMVVAADTGIVTIPADSRETLQVGDVFIAPGTLEFPEGIAMKVSDISEDEDGNQIVETIEPELEEIYENLEFAVRAVPRAEDVVVYDGVVLASAAENGIVNGDLLAQNSGLVIETGAGGRGGGGGSSFSDEGASFGFEVDFSKGKPNISPEWEGSFGKFEAELEKQEEGTRKGDKEAGEWFKKSSILYQGKADGSKLVDKVENKFSGGHELTGSIMIEDFYIDVDVKGLNSFYVKTNYNVTSTLKFKGKLEDELKIASFHMQTPIAGITVKAELIGYVEASGELELKFVTTNVITTSYAKGKFKKVDQSTAQVPDVSIAAEIEVGAGVKAAPCVMGMEIVDVKVKGGIKFNFEPGLNYEDRTEETEDEILTIRAWNFTLSGEKTFPVVKLEVGTGEKCFLKLNLKWELVGEHGLKKVSPTEMFDKEWLLCEEIMDRKNKEEEEEKTDEKEGNLEDSSTINIDSYVIGLAVGESSGIAITGLPEGYTEADLKWESINTAVATVSGGTVTAVGPGSTQIRISTADGKYEIFCTIMVGNDEEIEFQPL